MKQNGLLCIRFGTSGLGKVNTLDRLNCSSIESFTGPVVSAVVIRADLIAEEDQSGWNVFTYAAAPVA